MKSFWWVTVQDLATLNYERVRVAAGPISGDGPLGQFLNLQDLRDSLSLECQLLRLRAISAECYPRAQCELELCSRRHRNFHQRETMPTALLIIDVQTALCTGRYATFEADAVIARINAVSAKVRAAGGLVVLVQHESAEDAFAHGSLGWQLAPGLVVAEGDARVRKTASDAFYRTELNDLLHVKGIDRLIICGMQTEFCVDTTVRRALGLGYPVTLVSDGHSTLANRHLSAAQIVAHHNETLGYLDSFEAKVTLSTAEQVRP